MTASLAYLLQLQNATFSSLSQTSFKVAVVDMDDTGMSASQVKQLTDSGKTLFSYVSIGEAEDYRDYWKSAWNTQPPSFLLGENPDWEGNYRVKFWDPAWQQIMLDRAAKVVAQGYKGMYLDVVDAYTVQQVQSAYGGSEASLRKEMESFVIKLSNHVKAINPNFKVIPQNAVDLLGQNGEAGAANTAYLKAIDGVGVEDLFYNDNSKSSWTKWDLEYIKLAQNAGKFVLATSYPTQDALQADFVQSAVNSGLIPFVGTRGLDGRIDAENATILSKLPANWLEAITGSGTAVAEETPDTSADSALTLTGTSRGDVLSGKEGDDVLKGLTGNDKLYGNDGHDSLRGDRDGDTLEGGSGNDSLVGGADHDSLQGNAGADTLDGGSGNDTLNGGKDNDILIGNTGNDRLSGDTGNDAMTGGDGLDSFVFQVGSGVDMITDFANPGAKSGDVIYVSKSIYSTPQAILSHITYSDGDAILDFGGGNKVLIVGVGDSALTTHDFVVF